MDATLVARRYITSGLSIIPIMDDGSKRPKLTEWKEYQNRRANEAEVLRWFMHCEGFGVVTGKVSGNLEGIDFDAPDLFNPWCDLVEGEMPGLLKRLAVVGTPRGGKHVLYRCQVIEGNLKLARAKQQDGKIKTLIETRGEGGFVVAPPTPGEYHPSGKPYKMLRGEMTAIPTIKPEERKVLLEAARTFTQYVERIREAPIPVGAAVGSRPGDLYAAATPWTEILVPHGWSVVRQRGQTTHWMRPGKDGPGCSATTGFNGRDVLYVFSSNALPFESEVGYSKFTAYTILNHNGDFASATKAVAAMGYERKDRPREQEKAKPEENIPEVFQPETGPEHRSDLGNGKRFASQHRDLVRYCYNWTKWLVWDGKRWEKDATGAVERLAKETVGSIYMEAARAGDEDTRKKLGHHALRSEAVSSMKAMLEAAHSEEGIPIKPEELDADPWLLNCENGTIDLRTGELHKHKREDLITKVVETAYDPGAQCPKWEAYLERIMDGNEILISFLQRAVGYCLTGDTGERVMFILHGTGANGKTIFLESVQQLLADYSLRTNTEMLTIKRSGGIPNDLARLKGARFVYASEAEEGRRLAEALIKDITGGDTISARFMRSEWFDFRPEFKLWLGTNHKPVVRGTDGGIWGRLRLIPFTVTIPEGERIPRSEMLEAFKAELSGILAWAVRGCLEWRKSGLRIPREVTEATDSYRNEMDMVGAFIDDCCAVETSNRVLSKTLFSTYLRWCKDTDERPLHQKAFGLRLGEKGFLSGRGTGGARFWSGLSVMDLFSSDASDVSDASLHIDTENESPHEDICKNASLRVTRHSGRDPWDEE